MNIDIGKEAYEEINSFYHNNDNISVTENFSVGGGTDVCHIYVSSNGIWNPNDIETFRKRIENENYYEWRRLKGNNAAKYIYIRDVYKEWYVNGINSKINSIDNIIELLKEETSGYRIRVIGNSAGGYLASIIGIRLSAEAVISISGQTDITEYSRREREYPELYKNADNISKSKWFNIAEMLESSNIPIFYFYAGLCSQDIEQYSIIRNAKNVYPFAFNSGSHGDTMCKFNYPSVIDMAADELIRLSGHYKNKIISRLSFSLRTVGFSAILPYSRWLLKEISKKIKYHCKNIRWMRRKKR